MPAALSSEAFTEAFARHGRALWVIASAWVGRSEADDLVQEAARVAWQRRAQFVRGCDAGPWLATIVRNQGSNWRRKKRPESRAPDELPEAVAATIAAADWPSVFVVPRDRDPGPVLDARSNLILQRRELGSIVLYSLAYENREALAGFSP